MKGDTTAIWEEQEAGTKSTGELALDPLAAPPESVFVKYPASWYLFCKSEELAKGPISRAILGRRLVAFRTGSGKISVSDAHCAHMGADLGCGQVVGETIQCPYHNWRFGTDGRCVNIPGGIRIPAWAVLKRYPAVERHGYVFFFNGEEALFPLPFFIGEDASHFKAGKVFRYVADCSWYMNAAHGYDVQHFQAVHDRELTAPPVIDCPYPYARRNSYHAKVLGKTPLDRILKTMAGPTVSITITIWGGTLACITGDFDRASSRFMIVMTPLEDGKTRCEGIVYAKKSQFPLLGPLADRFTLMLRRFFTHGYLADEATKIRGPKYRPERLVASDREMAEYFNWVAALPQSRRDE